MNQKDFEQHVSMLLRDFPPGTTADLDDGIVAYWNGNAVVYAFLCEDGSGLVVEEFDLNDFVWSEFDAQFTKWSAAPKFSARAEVAGWLMDAPPYEAG
ncbi:hypothetical protein FVF58_09755 [Paraburkholderia panacisoli]|uniref:Uncharacterized protein n=1 Tax=Paraburkholderia panacisoli TaxID=2603818 RepID=A0A5B0HDK9_9BURK|nr:hypothetical protein [Paraburkholderia panacisoli]KAA1013064.1 hypothetical protein FVF58_09755 [Paraburkholderia panacisoli]